MKKSIFYNILYGFVILLISYSTISNDIALNNISLGICLFILFKMIFNYHKCTISYLECKIRGVEKEEGYIYNFMRNIININKTKYNSLVYIILITVVIILSIKKYNYSESNSNSC
jgi:hypothetical protein